MKVAVLPMIRHVSLTADVKSPFTRVVLLDMAIVNYCSQIASIANFIISLKQSTIRTISRDAVKSSEAFALLIA